jgi:hypothetical protein
MWNFLTALAFSGTQHPRPFKKSVHMAAPSRMLDVHRFF